MEIAAPTTALPITPCYGSIIYNKTAGTRVLVVERPYLSSQRSAHAKLVTRRNGMAGTLVGT